MATISNFSRVHSNLARSYSAVDERSKRSVSASFEYPVVDLVVNIPTSGRPDLLRRTLGSLGECELPAGYVETLVIENGPRAGAEEVVRSARRELRARYMHVPRGNKSGALNAALKCLGECLVFFTDDDVRFDRRTLCEYADMAREKGPGFFFGGPVNVDYEAAPPEWLREFLPCSAKGWRPNRSEGRIESERFIGSNWAAFSEDLR